MFNIKIALIKIINAKLETFKKHSIKSFLINIAFVIERLLSKKLNTTFTGFILCGLNKWIRERERENKFNIIFNDRRL